MSKNHCGQVVMLTHIGFYAWVNALPPPQCHLQSTECYDNKVQVQFVKDSSIVTSAFKC